MKFFTNRTFVMKLVLSVIVISITVNMFIANSFMSFAEQTKCQHGKSQIDQAAYDKKFNCSGLRDSGQGEIKLIQIEAYFDDGCVLYRNSGGSDEYAQYDAQGNRIDGTEYQPGAGSDTAPDTSGITPTITSDAGEAENEILKTGGKLLQPIVDLVMALADGIMSMLQSAVMGSSDAFLIVDKTAALAHIIIGIIVALAIVVLLAAFSGGLTLLASKVIAANAVVKMAAAAAYKIGSAIVVVATITIGGAVYHTATGVVDEALFPEITSLPMFSISPEEIFRGDILLFDVNIFNPKHVYKEYDDDGYYYWKSVGGKLEKTVTSQQNTAADLKSGIAKWYYTLRNLALIGMMLILIYVGIRMLITNIVSEKAKYKQLLFDWLVGICLIFVIHYIMIFAIELTQSITDLIAGATNNNRAYVIGDISEKHLEKYRDAFEAADLNPDSYIGDDENGNTIITWPTNLLGMERIQAQAMNGSATYVGHALCYVVLVLFTIFFAFTYGKRLLYIVFLTVIAPLIAVTYPLDKMMDGQAQGFNIWIKEYIFNLLLQPIHLILYTVLISMAYDLAATNIVYSLIAIGFMVPAEKLLRQLFNFGKAHTPGFFGGATGAAMLMTGLNTISKIGAGSGKSKSENGSSSDKIRMEDENERPFDSSHNFDALIGNMSGNNEDVDGKDYKDDENKDEDKENKANLFANEDNKDIDAENSELNDPEDYKDNNDIPINDNNPYEEDINAEDYKDDGINVELGARDKAFAKMAVKSLPGFVGKGVRISTALAAGMLGVAGGIASGDMGNVVKYGSGAAYAGGAIGKRLTNIPSGVKENAKKAQKLRDQYEKEVYGSDYSKYKRMQMDNAFEKDNKIRKKYAKELGYDDEYKEAVKKANGDKDKIKKAKEDRKQKIDSAMKEARKVKAYNVSNDDTVIKTLKLDEHHKARNENIAAAVIATNAKSGDKLSVYTDRLSKGGISQKQVDEIERKARKINKALE